VIKDIPISKGQVKKTAVWFLAISCFEAYYLLRGREISWKVGLRLADLILTTLVGGLFVMVVFAAAGKRKRDQALERKQSDGAHVSDT
jgi:hypothetical protein